MTGIHPQSPDDGHTDDAHNEKEDDRFNAALEAMMRGDRREFHELDPEMGSTIDQLFGWAELSGYSDEPATDSAVTANQSFGNDTHTATGPSASEPHVPAIPSSARAQDEQGEQSHNKDGKPTILETPAVSRASGSRRAGGPIIAIVQAIAAILLIAFAALGARSLVVDRTEDADPTEISLAAIDAIPTPTVSPTPTPYPTNVPDPSLTMAISPLAASDCVAEPRSRNELLDILGVPPADQPEMKIGSVPADAATREEINVLLRSWWACHTFGMTWEQSAYESKQYIRETIYGDPRISTAFSARALNELLNAQSRMDAERLSLLPPSTSPVPIVLPEASIWITPQDETGAQAVFAEISFVSAITGEALDETHEIYFLYEDGGWKIRAVDPGKTPLLFDGAGYVPVARRLQLYIHSLA